MLLEDSIRKTACIACDYRVRRIVCEERRSYFLEDETGIGTPIAEGMLIEIYNGGIWETLNMQDLDKKTPQGWPLMAGLETRMKMKGAANGTYHTGV